jgi:hypothetical protein
MSQSILLPAAVALLGVAAALFLVGFPRSQGVSASNPAADAAADGEKSADPVS